MQRIQHIVSDLKTFAYRKPGAEAELGTPFLFEKALDSAIRLVGHELRGVTVTRELPADTLVQGDEAAIIGVLINLLSNAVLAMRKAGTPAPAIYINVRWTEERLHVTVKDNGAYGLVAVQGTGKIGKHALQTPAMIDFGELTEDEYFVSDEAARQGVAFANTGTEPLVTLRYFGPEVNPDAPKVGDHKRR